LPIGPLLPEGVELENLIQNLRELSWGAADILIAYARGEKPPFGFPQVLEVEDGCDGPVSAADLAVNTWLLDGLKSKYSSIDWFLLSEENAKEKDSIGSSFSSKWMWILDPLDGTKDFLMGSGEYAVHLALVHNHEPVLGVVLIPEREELWFGVIGKGTWCENRFAEKTDISFSNRKEIDHMILVASRSHRDERLEKLINLMKFGQQKSVGSIGCKIATILRGESDLYISLSGETAPKDWDLAAPEVVLRAAGGEFSHANGKELRYNTGNFSHKGCLIASNGIKHNFLCEKILDLLLSLDPDFPG